MNNPIQRIVAALERIAASLERQAATPIGSVKPEALCKEDAARFIGVDEGTIDQLIRTRKLTYVQYGSQRGRVIAVESLRTFLVENRQEAVREMPQGNGRYGR